MTSMTTVQIADMVESFGIPFAYYQFEKDTARPCPFVCFYYSDSNDVLADNENYAKVKNLVIELYTDQKEFELEETIESILNQNEIVYDHYESYIDSEKMLMQTYESEVYING